MVESGIAGFEVTGWYGLAAPAGTPKAAIAKLNAETNRALKAPELVEQFRLQGYEPLGGTPDEMNAQIKTDVERWTKDHPRRRHPTAVTTWTRISRPTR